jgi:Ca2+-binding RTX toxin-like protein
MTLAAAAVDGIGNALGNVLTGNENGNQLIGLEGDDTLRGNVGNDMLLGGPGNDILDGGPGGDKMNGGSGDDVYIVANDGDIIAADESGTDLVISSIGFTLPTTVDVEHLTLTGLGNLQGTGNGLDNVITGNGGRNELKGEGGDDRLRGGLGVDFLTGGTGGDAFVYGDIAEAPLAERIIELEHLLDFDSTAADKIDVSLIDANNDLSDDDQMFAFIGEAEFSGAPGELRTWRETFTEGSGNVLHFRVLGGDVSGDGAADFMIVQMVAPGTPLFAITDFVL